MTYPSVFHLVSALTKKSDVKIVLIGGFAVNYYGVTRQTADADFLITKKDFEKVVLLFKKEGYEEDHAQELFTRLRTDRDYIIDLDFVFVDEETLSKIIKAGTKINIADQEFIVPSLNHLIALKLHSIENNPKSRMNKDMPDIIELIKANKVDAANKEFKELCLKYGTPDLYNEILDKI